MLQKATGGDLDLAVLLLAAAPCFRPRLPASAIRWILLYCFQHLPYNVGLPGYDLRTPAKRTHVGFWPSTEWRSMFLVGCQTK
jgi:hypothetical protein